jgi:hypothetical protein
VWALTESHAHSHFYWALSSEYLRSIGINLSLGYAHCVKNKYPGQNSLDWMTNGRSNKNYSVLDATYVQWEVNDLIYHHGEIQVFVL